MNFSTKNLQYKESLRLGILDAFLYSTMVGAGESYLPAYAISLGLGEVSAGVLTSLPLVTGAFFQLFTPQWVQKIKNPKLWIVLTAFLQACVFLPLILFSAEKKPDFWVLFLIFSLYWASGFSISPYWNFWMTHLVPDEFKKNYFSFRARVSQLGVLLGLVGGGVALHYDVEFIPFSNVFSGLFFLAFLCRVLSSFVLYKKVYLSEWNKTIEREIFSYKQTIFYFFKSSTNRQFLFLLFPYYASIFISAPFVSPFLLAQMKLEYSQFMWCLVFLLFGKFFSAWVVEKLGERVSVYQIFFYGVLIVSPGPMFWGLSTNFYFLLAIQFFSGMALACYEVGIQLILFKDIKVQDKIPFISMFNFFMSVAGILGTFFGAQFINHFGAHFTTYIALFVLGGLARVIFAAPLLTLIKNRELVLAMDMDQLDKQSTSQVPSLSALPEDQSIESPQKSDLKKAI